MPALSMSFMQPAGVAGRSPGSPVSSSPALATEKPSTSLAGAMAATTACASSCGGSGICTRMPWIAGSALSSAMRASSSACASAAGQVCCTERMPHSAQALTLLRT